MRQRMKDGGFAIRQLLDSQPIGTVVLLAVLSTVGLAPAECLAQGGPKPDRLIGRMDADGDGRISRSEWLRPPQVFDRIDRDGDGYATAEELTIFLQNRFSGRSGPQAGSRTGGGRGRTRAGSAPEAPTTGPMDIIDTHVHLGFGPKERDFEAGVAEALSKMPQRHVALAILIPTPQLGSSENRYDHDDLRRVARSDRFRIAGGSGVLGEYLYADGPVSEQDKEAFRRLAQSMVDKGIVAFGEIGLYHFGVPQAGNVFGRVPLDHPLLDVLADVAAKSGIPIDVHFEVLPRSIDLPQHLQGAGNPDHLEANLPQFERFLTRNEKAKIIWAHAGFEALPFRTPRLCMTLLQRHENLFMSIRLTRGSQKKPSAAMDGDGNLKEGWRRLFMAFPDRFVLGGESVYGSSQSHRFENEFVLYQNLLAQLPPSVARKIASSNARAIYRLGTKK